MILLLLACSTTPLPPGLLVVSLDTLRADHLGAYGSTQGLTPNLDRFAEQSILFEETYAQANETLYSHAALFANQYASRMGPLDRKFQVPENIPTLAAVFQNAGWDTAGFVAGGHLSREFGLNRGFSVYDDAAAWGSLRDTGPKALHWLDTRDPQRPFLLFVHGYDTHDRYLKPTPFGYAFADPAQTGLGADLARRVGGVSQILDGRYEEYEDVVESFSLNHPRFARGKGIEVMDPAVQSLSEADKKLLAASYAGSVAWMDASFGLFMAGLEARGLLDRLTIVVMSDHGEELGEKGVFHHRYSLEDLDTHVPLMVRMPKGQGGGRRVSGLVELLDLGPTLVELAGLRGLQGGPGRSLAGVLKGGDYQARPMAISEGALRLVSARGPHARLEVEGFRAENPWLVPALTVAPVDGQTLRLTGDAAELPVLRQGVLDFFAGKNP